MTVSLMMCKLGDKLVADGLLLTTHAPGVMHKCPHKPEACKFRHYYVSSEEKLRGVESRRAAGMRREMNVLKAITHREGLLSQIRKETDRATARFQDHMDAHVREEDVSDLLSLLNQQRAATVKVIEAINEWRTEVEQMRRREIGGGGGSELVRGWGWPGWDWGWVQCKYERMRTEREGK